MTLQYSVKRAELAAWYWHSLRTNPKHRTGWLVCMGSLAIAGFSVAANVGHASLATAAAAAIGVAAVGAIFFAGYPQLRYKPEVRILTADSTGLATAIGTRAERYDWAAVDRIRPGPSALLIQMRNANAFIVPDRAFGSAEQRDAFIAECAAYRAAAIARAAA